MRLELESRRWSKSRTTHVDLRQRLAPFTRCNGRLVAVTKDEVMDLHLSHSGRIGIRRARTRRNRYRCPDRPTAGRCHGQPTAAQGFQVIVSRVDTAVVDQCTVSAVRPGQTFSRTDSGVPGADDDLVTTVTNKTVYVDVTC
jgi:hypothetical protein